MKRVLIVGFGSIGERHARIYKGLGASVAVVSARPNDAYRFYGDIQGAVRDFSPDIVVVSNETNRHIEALADIEAAGFAGVVVIEKPLAEKVQDSRAWSSSIVVAYNLRESEVLKVLKRELEGQVIVTANISCGQYLPDWRPGRDYRGVYSSQRSKGGGVLRDLSHELDYALWILGSVKEVVAIGGHLSELEIDCDDVIMFLAKCVRCPALSVSINYLDRIPRREIVINTDRGTYFGDLIKGRLTFDREVLVEADQVSETYERMAANILLGSYESYCNYHEANEVLNLIESVENSILRKEFVHL